MLGQPALVPGHGGSDAEREALLAEQRVAAVAAAEGPDRALLGKVDDVLGLVARPGHVLLARRQRRADGMQAGDEIAVAQHIQYLAPHPRHDLHADRRVRGIGDLDADVGDGRAQRSHAERAHIQGAAAHAAVEKPGERPLHLVGVGPVVGRPGVLGLPRTDEGAVLDPGHVAGIGTGEIASRAFFFVEPDEGAALHHLPAQAVVFFLGTVTPVDGVGLAQALDLIHPGQQLGVAGLLTTRHASPPNRSSPPPRTQSRRAGSGRGSNANRSDLCRNTGPLARK